ncbi:MAG: hypothetical protein P4K83_02035 [Terracidiphilus sp.]|nr:hypothetical protein [Terracidiphilus sp.]
MRRGFLAMFWSMLFVFSGVCAGAQAAGAAAKPKPMAQKSAATADAVENLPVRKVVLYKNGVGYFEHAGTVNGNQKVSIDFTSPQLNDVLQSLTVLDEGGGRIGGVNYNSTTPLAEQLKSLSLGMDDDPTSTELFQALRGQRVEVTGAPGGPINGRLMSIEARSEKAAGTDAEGNANTIDRFYLTVVAGSGAVRVIELTPQLSVKPLDGALQGQLDRYLELLSTTHANGLRHLTLNAVGQGQRQLRVSYISEVPVWKATYRMVFPKEQNGKAMVQGWAVVDNTVGADWDNVKLALVAGAPQSFIQPLSQPIYSHRQEIPIATEEQLTPQTHEAAEELYSAQKSLRRELKAPVRVPHSIQMVTEHEAPAASFGVAGMEGMGGSVANTGRGMGIGAGGGMGGNAGGVYDAVSEGDVATKAFDDFFEYALAQPVTIHKNESAMVPILQQELPAEHVTLWSEREPAPLRAVWLENASKLTLDKGSFSIFESGEFAGEGLLDPIHPGERRLLSYAADQAVRVRVTERHADQKLHHVSVQKGVVVETRMDESNVTYTVTNSADVDRAVLIETPRRQSGWTLDDGLKADETAADVYRFKVAAKAHDVAKLEVRQHGPEMVRVELNARQNQTGYLLELVKRVPGALDALKPVIDAQTGVAQLEWKIAESKKNEETAASDEARARENVTALKGNDAARRFVEDLNRSEDALQAARKHTVELEGQKNAAIEKLNGLIAGLNFDWSVEKTGGRE